MSKKKVASNPSLPVESKPETFKSVDRVQPLSRLKFFITIVNHNHYKEVLKILRNHESGLGFITHGRGTGTKEIYDLLGLSDVHKDIIFAVVKADQIETLKKEIAAFFVKESKGIAFAIDISSVIGSSIYKYLSNTRPTGE